MSIKVSQLTKIYGTQKALNEVSFEAYKGQILGLLGPNGAGKSTLMKIASGYISPTSGDIEVNGTSVTANPQKVKRQIGYLPEHNPLYLDMFVKEFLDFSGRLYGLKGQHLKTRVNEIIELCGLTLEQHKKLGALSKGYRQRAGLAQALIHDPSVLILDEPTTGLDPNQIIDIRKLIKTVSQDKTVIFSTHIMQEVMALCDRIVIIDLGRIVANDTLEKLQKGLEGSSILVEFVEEIEETELAKIPGVTSVTKTGKGSYKILTSGKEDIRPLIFSFAKDAQKTLLGLKEEENSIEKVFRELTVKNENK